MRGPLCPAFGERLHRLTRIRICRMMKGKKWVSGCLRGFGTTFRCGGGHLESECALESGAAHRCCNKGCAEKVSEELSPSCQVREVAQHLTLSTRDRHSQQVFRNVSDLDEDLWESACIAARICKPIM